MNEIVEMVKGGFQALQGFGINPWWVPVIVGGYGFLKMKPKGKGDKLANNEFKTHLKGLEGRGGLPLAKHITLSVKACSENIMIFGPTGEGKSTSLYITALLDNNIEGSIIVCDPKGEHYRLTSHFQETVCKRKVYVYAPLMPIHSNQYNILTECKSVTEVKQLAQSLLINGALSLEIQTGKKAQGVEWLQMSESLLTSALLYCKERGTPYNTVKQALELLLSTDDLTLAYLYSKASKAVQNEFKVFQSCTGANNTEGGIKITLASNMSLFNDPNIVQTMKRTDFTAEQFRKEKSILYVVYPPYMASYVSPLLAPMYSQIINHTMASYTSDSLPLWFLGDEFANIGQLQNFSQVISTVRHYNIKMCLCMQDLSQLYRIYGKESTNTILNNCKTKIILPSLSDEETLRYISTLLGDKEVTIRNETQTKESTTVSYTKQKVRFMDASDIRQMEKDTLVIVAHNLPPVKAKQNIYYKNPEYLKRVWERELPIV